MRGEFYVLQRSRSKWMKCPLSGHEWREEELVDIWDIKSPYGMLGSYRSESAAETALIGWKEFYEKYPPGW